MNPMGHETPLMIGVDQKGVEGEVRELLPDYMAMGQHGMEEMTEMKMKGPANTLPMMTSDDGPFGSTGMGGMFTIFKVRNSKAELEEGGWFKHPAGTVAQSINPKKAPPEGAMEYVCPMHPEIRQDHPGNCSICGMKLLPQPKEAPKEGQSNGAPEKSEHQHH